MNRSVQKIKKSEQSDVVTKGFLLGCFEKYNLLINSRFTNLESKTNKLERRFDKLENSFDKLERKFDKLENRFNILENRFNVLENSFDNFEKKFDSVIKIILGELAAIRSESKEFRLIHEELYRSDHYLDSKIDHIDKRVLKLETKTS